MIADNMYRDGYAQAITDICNIFDAVHEKYVQAFKRDDTTEEELRCFELQMVTLNTIICELNSRLMYGKPMV